MKKIYLGLTAVLLSTVIYSCKKNTIQKIDTPVDVANTAQIKYFNFGINTPSVNFYANGNKVTGVTSTSGAENATATTSGGVYPQSGYSVIPGAVYTFKAQIAATATADPNLAIATVNATLDNSKFYTLYTSGIYNTTAKTSDAFVIEDKLPAYNNAFAYIRFVNTIPNGTSAFDFYVKNTTITPSVEAKIATAAAYKSAGEFLPVLPGNYELYVRLAGQTANFISRTGTSVVSLVGGKVYTLAVRGDATVTSTTATNRPQIDFTANR